MKEVAGMAVAGFSKANPFLGMTSIKEIGTTAEGLTKEILQDQFKNADIYGQVKIKMGGGTFVADHVVVQDGKVIGVFESKASKVGGGRLSNGQKLFFNEGEVGEITGKNAPEFLRGVKVDPSKVQTGVYRWNTVDATFKFGK